MDRQSTTSLTLAQCVADIDRALASGDTAQAVSLAQDGLDAGYSHPLLFHLCAIRLMQNRAPQVARTHLERALRLAPRSPELLTEMAGCLNALGDYAGAQRCAADAIALAPGLAIAWYQKGYAHQMSTELDAAKDCFLEAVRLDPRAADAFARLAHIAAGQGHYDEAKSHAAKALVLEPRNGAAMLANAAADIAEERLSAAQSQLDIVLSDPQALPPVRAVAAAQAGDICDAQGRVDEAFDAYRQAGETWRTYYEPHVRGAKPESALALVARLSSSLEALPAGQWR